MALIFAPLARLNGGVTKVNIGTGAVNQAAVMQGVKVDDGGAVYAVEDGVINHYHQGLPFDQYGRLVISNTAPAYFSMSVPFAASGAVAGSW